MNDKSPTLPLGTGTQKNGENADNGDKSDNGAGRRKPGRPVGSGSQSKLMAISVAAQMLGIDVKTLRAKAAANEIEHELTKKGQLRFRRSVIEEARRSSDFAQTDAPRSLICALVPAGRASRLTAGMKRVGQAFGCDVQVFALGSSGLPPAELVMKISTGETIAVLLPSEDAKEFPRDSQIWLIELCKGRRMPVIYANGGELPPDETRE